MKFGAGYTREHADNDSARAITRPTFNFDSVFDFAADRPSSEGQIAIDPRTGAAPSLDQALPSHAVGLRVRAGRVEGAARTSRSARGLRYEGFLNIHDASDDIMTNIEFPIGDRQPAERPARPRAWCSGSTTWTAACGAAGSTRLGPRLSFAWDPTERGQDVDPRRRGPLLRAHVEPDLGLRAPEPARLRQHVGDASSSPCSRVFSLGTSPAAALRLPLSRRASPRASTSTAAC